MVVVANLDIAGVRNRSVAFPSLTSLGHTTLFSSSVNGNPMSAVVSQTVVTPSSVEESTEPKQVYGVC